MRLLALQYRVGPGAFDANLDRASALVEQAEAQSVSLSTRSLNLEPRSQGSESRSLSPSKGGPAGLLVLPAFSFSGWPGSAEEAAAYAEHGLGRTVQAASDFAVRLGWHVACSHVEREGDRLFHAAVLIAPNGTVAGRYRQTHLDPSLTWATAGDDLPVIDTAIGRVGMLLGEDVRFPEVAGVLAVRRADLIAVPTRWDGPYGGPLHDAGGLFANQYPDNTMCLWYAVSKTTQAYTVVANPVDDGCQVPAGSFRSTRWTPKSPRSSVRSTSRSS